LNMTGAFIRLQARSLGRASFHSIGGAT